jgi:glycosyltransferase involved in cell wall biosynthesis
VLLMFSRSEGFGLVTIEAMLRGIPVIGYDGGATGEIITHEETGYLFCDEDSFLKVVHKLLQFKNYEKIRIKALRSAKELFSNEKYCFKISEFISKIIESK